MTNLPPDLAAFAQLLDAQPEPACPGTTGPGMRAAFNYCLALMMAEAGVATLIETRPGETGTICVFEPSAGEVFSLARPAPSAEREAEVVRGVLMGAM
jgi:hypothetical protein